MVNARQLAKKFSWIDLEPWIVETEARIQTAKYPSKVDIELLPKLKEALEIVNNAPTLSDEECEALNFDTWATEHEAEFL